jgi:hypothetical protein
VPSSRKQLNVRMDEESEDRLARLVVAMRQAIGIRVSQSDVVRAALVELEKLYPQAPPEPTRGRPRKPARRRS